MSGQHDDEYPLLLDDGQVSINAATDATKLGTLQSTLTTKKLDPRPASKGRINDRFLKNLIRNTEGHNLALLRKEREERLGLRKHPLVDKIKEIERKKLDRHRSQRRRSRSPVSSPRRHESKAISRSGNCLIQREEDTKSSQPVIRGRGSRSSVVLNKELDDTNATCQDSADMTSGSTDPLYAGSSDTHVRTQSRPSREPNSRPLPPWATGNPEDNSTESWPFMTRTTVVIEEDEQGKWKCGAGYL